MAKCQQIFKNFSLQKFYIKTCRRKIGQKLKFLKTKNFLHLPPLYLTKIIKH